MIFSRCMLAPGIADRAEKSVQAQFLEALSRPLILEVADAASKAGAPKAALLRQHASEPHPDVPIDLLELVRRVARTEVVAPSAQHRVERFDHFSNVAHPGSASPIGQLADLGADARHRPG